MPNLPTDAKSQCKRLLKYLKEHGSITKKEAREKLDILEAAARIYELRHIYGFNIQTIWETLKTEYAKHSVGRYVLRSGTYKENKS